MLRSRTAEAALIGCLATLAGFCGLQAWGEETYAIVAQSTKASAATGRRPLAERIASANLPIIVPTAATVPVNRVVNEAAENMAVAAVKVVEPPEPTDAEAVAQNEPPKTQQPREKARPSTQSTAGGPKAAHAPRQPAPARSAWNWKWPGSTQPATVRK